MFLLQAQDQGRKGARGGDVEAVDIFNCGQVPSVHGRKGTCQGAEFLKEHPRADDALKLVRNAAVNISKAKKKAQK